MMKFRGKKIVFLRYFDWIKETFFFPQMFMIAQGKSICVHYNSYQKVQIFEIHVILYRDAVVNKDYQGTFILSREDNVV